MKLEDYISAQSALSQTLAHNTGTSPDFALFSTMLGEYIDIDRQHIDTEQDFPSSHEPSGIAYDTQKQFHLKAENKDFELVHQLAQSLHTSSASFRLLMSASSHPLSMHNDPQHICDEVIANCQHATQQKHKGSKNDEYFEDDAALHYPQQSNLMHDIIQQSQDAYKAFEI